MFETTIGPVKEAGSTVYLRPETAQGIFLDFKTDAPVRAPQAAVRHRAGRQVVPQRDHARQLHLPHARVRADGDGVLRAARRGRSSGTSTGCRSAWTGTCGSASTASACACARTTPTSSRTTRRPRATSSTCTRSAGRSSRASPTAATSTSPSTPSSRGEKLEYFDPQTGERYVPHVIEPAAGVGRSMLALLCDAYDEDEIGGEQRTVLRLHPALAPVKVAVLPLLRKDGHPEKAREVYEELRRRMQRRVRRGRRDRQALPPPGRDRHAVRGHDRPPDARGRHGHAARPRHARRRSACRSTSSRRARVRELDADVV